MYLYKANSAWWRQQKAAHSDERAKQKILDTLCYGGEVGKGGTIEDALTRDIWELAKQGEELAILQLKINMQLSFAVMAIVDTENGKTGSEETANKIDKLSTVLASLGGPDECVELDDENVLETVLTGSAGVDKSEVEGSLQNLLKKAKEVSNASSEELLETSLTQKIGGFYSAVKNIQCLNQDKLKELSDNISISKCSEDSLTEKVDEAACLRIASQETISAPLRIDILGKDINYQDDSLTATSNGAFVDYFDKDNS